MRKKNLVKILSIIFTLIALSTCVALAVSAAGTSVNVNDETAYRGETVTFNATLSESVVVGSGSLAISYDPNVLELTGGSCNVSGAMLANFDVAKGKGAFAFSGTNTVSGNLFTVTFRVKDAAAFGTTDVSLTVTLKDGSNKVISLTNNDGSITVKCNHSFTKEDTTYIKSEATCTSPAIYYKSCATCGEKGTETFEYGSTAEHSYTKQVTTDAYKKSSASCTAKAVYYYCCATCDVKGTNTYEYGTTLSHDYTRKVVTDTYKKSAATCTDAAVYYYCCATCDAKGTTTYTNGSELGHTGGTATCTAKAECTRCHQPYGNMLEHVYTDQDATATYLKSAATCTSKAVYYKNCATCDKAGTATFEYGATAPHSYTKQVTTDAYKKSDASCTAKAVYYYCCSTCSAKGTTTFEYGTTLSHTYTRKVVTDTYKKSSATCTEAAVYYFCCTTCDAKGTTTYTNGSELGHTGGTATCTAKAECTRCHQPYGDMLEHVYTDQDATATYLKSAATCTSKAVYYKNCATCDKAGTATFEYGSTEPHSYTKQVTTATYLKSAATCTSKAVYYHCCATCDAKGTTTFEHGTTLSHNYTRKVVTDTYKKSAATCTDAAVYYYCCSTCDAKGTTTYTNGSELGHTGGTATCTAKAECTRCNELYGNMLEHVYTDQDATAAYLKSAATCTSKAVYYKNCATCDKAGTATFEYGSTEPHSYTKQVTMDAYKKSDASCTAKAVYYYCCATCDAKGTTTFEHGTTLSHNYTRKVVTDTYKKSAATCTDAAVYYYCCATCDAKGTTTYTNGSELGHTGGTATCTAKAECTRCHELYGNMLEHVYTAEDATDAYLKSAATCTSKAVYYKHCATCDKAGTATFEYGNFKAHSYIEKVEDAYLKSAATCTSKAVYYKSCSACGVKGTETFEVGDAPSHNYQTTWSSDATSHWHECSKCGDKKDTASHTAGAAATESTAQTCTVCGYVITPALGHTHNYNTTWSNNATEHWHDCIGCSSTKDNAPHDYTNACDTDCNTCGYVRTITHSYKTEWSSNAEKHWYECSVCGDKSSEASHTPGAEATETTDQVCTVCGFVIQEALGHTHNYDNIKKDEVNHWKECACGEKNEITAHTWNNGEVTKEATVDAEGVKTYTCTYCSTTKTESIPKIVVNIEDTDSGVTLEIPSNSQATLPAGTVIDVVDKSNESISDQILDEFAETAETVVTALGVYDLNLILDGVKIQPNGAVVVTLPAPKLNAEYDRIIVVYIAPDGSYEECKTTVNADGSISFETDHFSKYAVIGINEEESDNGLGIGAIIAIIVGALLVVGAGGFAIYWFVIKKKATPAEEIATDTNEASNDASNEEQK